MFTKEITYTDYNGNERTEKFYFNLSKKECSDLNLETKGGVENFGKRLIETQDMQGLTKFIDKILVMAIGRKSDDGRSFDKSPEAKRYFTETEAYSDYYMELVNDPDKLAEFINGIVPKIPADDNNVMNIKAKPGQAPIDVSAVPIN